MKISRNKITGEIKEGNLGEFFRTGDWVNVLDDSGNTLPAYESDVDAKRLSDAKDDKIQECRELRFSAINAPIQTINDKDLNPIYVPGSSHVNLIMAHLHMDDLETREFETCDSSGVILHDFVELTKAEIVSATEDYESIRATQEALFAKRSKDIMALTDISAVDLFDINQVY